MKILVTGANGFLGAALVRRLLARGEGPIRCLVRQGSDASRLHAIEKEHAGGIEIASGTLNRPADCARAVDGVDLVHHVAAAMTGAPADMFMSSVVATKNLLEAMAASGRPLRMVFVSSFAVYGVASLPWNAKVDESTPLEPHPEMRDVYSHMKQRQEELVWQYHGERGIPVVVARPGVIYGPGGGGAISMRVGLDVFGVFVHMGGGNLLPLSYVDNCAEALALMGAREDIDGEAYNVLDDVLISSRGFLRRYRRSVKKLRFVPLPYPLTSLMSRLVEAYSRRSRGQLPAVFTPYKSASMWKGNRFDNRKLKALGWHPLVSTDEGLARHFAYLRSQADS